MTLARKLIYSCGLAAALALAGFSSARAQDPGTDRTFDVQLFQSAVGPRSFITLDSARVPAHKQFGLALVSSYQRDPFSIFTVSGQAEERTVDVVRNQLSSELVGAIGLLDKFEVGLAVPLTLYMDGQDFTATGMAAGASLTGGGVGDVRVEGKAALATFGPSEEFFFALAPGLTLPSGNGGKFQGDKTVTGRLRGLLEFRPMEDFRAGAMLGFLFRDTSKAFAAEVGHQLLYGLGVDYRVHRQVSLLGELMGRSGLRDFGQRYVDANPVELDVGMRVGLPHMLTLAFGGGAGVVKGIGAPAFRGFLALGWAPDFRDRDGDGVYDVEDRCPDEPEDFDDHKDGDGCPELDNDGDGLMDAQDKCPGDAEDLDQHKDDDGCPEADNDQDGIPDLNDPCPNAAEDGRGKRTKDGCPSTTEDEDGDGLPDGLDKCPDEPEDRDNFEDRDGCPDIDNDNDGIPDTFDGCPNDAEDADGFEDSDGCGDPDNDKDGVADAQDKCPAQAETLNGNQDADGCPDPGAEIVMLGEERIDVRERIGFGGAPNAPQLSAGAQAVVKLVAMPSENHRA